MREDGVVNEDWTVPMKNINRRTLMMMMNTEMDNRLVEMEEGIDVDVKTCKGATGDSRSPLKEMIYTREEGRMGPAV